MQKFQKINRSLETVLGKEQAKAFFPEFETLPEKLSIEEQVELASLLVNRMDEGLDEETIDQIRKKHPCAPSPKQNQKIEEIKGQFPNWEKRIEQYSKALAPGFCKIVDSKVIVDFGIRYCVCPFFRKASVQPNQVSLSWCLCCGGHTEKMFEKLCDVSFSAKPLSSYLHGEQSCVFELTRKNK